MPGLRRYPRRRGMRIKSIQRGTFTMTTTGTATISSVDTATSELHLLAWGQNGTTSGIGTDMSATPYLVLTNATTITGTRNGSSDTITVQYQVIEWAAAPLGRAMRIKSIQRGTFTIASGATVGTATIPAVVTALSSLRSIGSNVTTNQDRYVAYALDLTATTTITATRGSNLAITYTVSYEVIEWEEINVSVG